MALLLFSVSLLPLFSSAKCTVPDTQNFCACTENGRPSQPCCTHRTSSFRMFQTSDGLTIRRANTVAYLQSSGQILYTNFLFIIIPKSAEEPSVLRTKLEPLMQHTLSENTNVPLKRTLRVRVTKSSLKNATGKQLRPQRWWRRLGVGQHTKVSVEPWEGGRSDSIFYAPFSGFHTSLRRSSSQTTLRQSNVSTMKPKPSDRHEEATPARFIDIHPDWIPRESLVDPSEDFEISFVGMTVPPFDFFRHNNNELLLFSLSSVPSSDNEAQLLRRKAKSARDDCSFRERANSPMNMDSQTFYKSVELAASVAAGPAFNTFSGPNIPGLTNNTLQSGLHSTDVPKIHYDPDSDGHQAGTAPDTFVSIPASKSLFMQHSGSSSARTSYSNIDPLTGSVPIRFTVMEIDRVTKAQASAVACATELGSMASASGVVVPYSNIISWAISFASDVSTRQLRHYSRPDYVMSADVVFRLVKKHDDGSVTDIHGKPIRYAGPFLQYGYYFFLNGNVDAKMYAQTETSSQNVPLLLRQESYNALKAAKGEKELFPLNGVSYVVMKVTPGKTLPSQRAKHSNTEHERIRLDYLLRSASSVNVLDEMKKNRTMGAMRMRNT